MIRAKTGPLLLVLLLSLALLHGCGGGGGGGSETGVDPIEVEINAVLDGFLTTLNNQNYSGSMEFIDSNLQYRRLGDTTVYPYSGYQTFLKSFLEGVSSLTVTLTERGITGFEDSAVARVQLSYHYLDSGNIERTYSENCEIVLERVSKWGIRSLSGYNLEGLRFPPAP